MEEKSLRIILLDLLNDVGFYNGSKNERMDELMLNHLQETPERLMKAWKEMLGGYNMKVDMKISSYNGNSLVGMSNIEFSSLCIHHLLPFSGSVDIIYMPSNVICGASKLARVVDMFSKRLQLQEFLMDDIYEYIYSQLIPEKLGVRIISKHSCVGCRGVMARNSEFITIKTSNNFSKEEFLGAIKYV